MTTAPNVLIVKLSSLGDLFHALPAVHALKKALHWNVDWITQPEYVELVQCFDDVDRVLAFPRRQALRSCRQWLSDLRHTRYDLVLDFQGLLKSALVARMARADRRIGPLWHREGSRLLYSEVAGLPDKRRHAAEEACDLARHLGVSVESMVFPVTFPAREAEGTAPRIAYVPCSRWPTKDADPDFFADLIRALHREKGGTAFLLGAPDDRDTLDRLATGLEGVDVRNLCGRTSIVELGSVLQAMDLVVTVDSGPMHMAAALGRPVVALFGPTDPKRTGPYGVMHRVLQRSELDCVPCHSRTCQRPQRDHACMRRWDVADVMSAIPHIVSGRCHAW